MRTKTARPGDQLQCRACKKLVQVPRNADVDHKKTKLICRNCSTKYEVDYDLAGKVLKCPACHQHSVMPLPSPYEPKEDSDEPPTQSSSVPVSPRTMPIWVWAVVIGASSLILLPLGFILGRASVGSSADAKKPTIPDPGNRIVNEKNPVIPDPRAPQRVKDADTAANQSKDKPSLHFPVMLTEKQKAAAADAIKALGRVEAAVEVGVNYRQYSQLVIDAKAVVNEAKRALPAGNLLTSLSECMLAYGDAATVWNHKIQYGFGLYKRFGHGGIIKRYKLPVKFNQAYKEEGANPDLSMQIIWAAGAKALANARSQQ
jgi:hypothetical protein